MNNTDTNKTAANSNRIEFRVKYKYGKCTVIADLANRKFLGPRTSRNMVEQILEQINPRMREIFGCYAWRIVGCGEHYAIIADANFGTRNHNKVQATFTESDGRTPAEAFWNCFQVRTALAN